MEKVHPFVIVIAQLQINFVPASDGSEKSRGYSARKIFIVHDASEVIIDEKVFNVRVKPLKPLNTSNEKTSFYKNLKQSNIRHWMKVYISRIK